MYYNQSDDIFVQYWVRDLLSIVRDTKIANEMFKIYFLSQVIFIFLRFNFISTITIPKKKNKNKNYLT